MAEYQALWEKWGWTGLNLALARGFGEAAWDWVAEFGEAEYWEGLGDSISGAFWATVDAAANAYDATEELIEDAYENRGDVLERAWWESRKDDVAKAARETAQSLTELAADTAGFIERTTAQTEAMYRHRNAILALPEQIANGDVNAVESFIDNELRDIDPELADEIKYSENWQGTIELLEDGESVSLVVVYLGLFTSAVPPTFLAHAMGKAGFYVLIEAVLLILGALLGGAGAAARIGMLTAKFASFGAKAGNMGRKVKNAKRALDAFISALDDFVDVMKDLDKLREKLPKSRRPHGRKGRTNQSLEERRKTEKRKRHCRVCKKTDHTTPKQLKGTLKYE